MPGPSRIAQFDEPQGIVEVRHRRKLLVDCQSCHAASLGPHATHFSRYRITKLKLVVLILREEALASREGPPL